MNDKKSSVPILHAEHVTVSSDAILAELALGDLEKSNKNATGTSMIKYKYKYEEKEKDRLVKSKAPASSVSLALTTTEGVLSATVTSKGTPVAVLLLSTPAPESVATANSVRWTHRQLETGTVTTTIPEAATNTVHWVRAHAAETAAMSTEPDATEEKWALLPARDGGGGGGGSLPPAATRGINVTARTARGLTTAADAAAKEPNPTTWWHLCRIGVVDAGTLVSGSDTQTWSSLVPLSLYQASLATSAPANALSAWSKRVVGTPAEYATNEPGTLTASVTLTSSTLATVAMSGGTLYMVQWRTGTTGGWTQQLTSASSLAISGTSNTALCIRVAAIARFTGEFFETVSAMGSSSGTRTVFPTPRLVYSSRTSSRVTFTGSLASGTTSSRVAQYLLDYTLDNVTWTTATTSSSSSSVSLQISSLSNNTTVYAKVRLRSQNVTPQITSAGSDFVMATTQSGSASALATPTLTFISADGATNSATIRVAWTGNTPSQLRLMWTAVDDGNRITLRTDTVTNTSATSWNVVVTGLRPGGIHAVHVASLRTGFHASLTASIKFRAGVV